MCVVDRQHNRRLVLQRSEDLKQSGAGRERARRVPLVGRVAQRLVTDGLRCPRRKLSQDAVLECDLALIAARFEDHYVLRRADEPMQERRLPDPRLPFDRDDLGRGTARGVQGGGRQIELRLATDKDTTIGHGRHRDCC